MKQFIEERAKLVRELASKADPFTKNRLLQLAQRYDRELGRPSRVEREIKSAILPLVSLPSER